jgi:hypothetical protein
MGKGLMTSRRSFGFGVDLGGKWEGIWTWEMGHGRSKLWGHVCASPFTM